MPGNELLTNLLRFYGDSLQGIMGEYLENSVNRFVERETRLREQMHTVQETRAGIASTTQDRSKR